MSSSGRILIAAVKSGSGKTTFTCGLLELLKEHYTLKAAVKSHKCGPDYIDPMFHKRVLGIEGTNLDPFFSGAEELKQILAEDQCAITVIEGAMGIYDGISGMGKTGSCYDVAEKTGTPVLLLADAKGMGATILSVIKGILMDDSAKLIRGIVFNRMSDAYLQMLKSDLLAMFEQIGRPEIRILGAVPKSDAVTFESRHLGLVMPEEVDDITQQIKNFADLLKEHIEIDTLLEIAAGAERILPKKQEAKTKTLPKGPSLRLGVARDEAFCFYYERNLKAFSDRGVEIVPFSPITDKELPKDLSGLLLGGGYPELYLPELSANASMKQSIRDAIHSGMPSLAECGGFMYLGAFIKDENGVEQPMAGLVDSGFENRGKLTRFGYVTVTPEKEGLLPGPVRAHEFHYFDSENNGSDCLASKPASKRSWSCIHMGDHYLWGYPHLYYPSCPELVDRFVEQMIRYAGKDSKRSESGNRKV